MSRLVPFLVLALSACGSASEVAPPAAAPTVADPEVAVGASAPSPEPEVGTVPSRPPLSSFLRSLATRMGDGLYVQWGSVDTARVHCGGGARSPVCQQCYAHVFTDECGPEEQELLCDRAGPYARPPANLRHVECAADGARCWLDRPPLGNAPSGDRVTWFFDPSGRLEALVYSEPGVPASLDREVASRAVASACGFHSAVREGRFATDHVGVLVHRYSSEVDGPRRNLERHLCGEGVADLAGQMVRSMLDGDELDECAIAPLRCEYGLDHARLVVYGRDRGEGVEPRFVLDGITTEGAPLDEEFEARQRQDVSELLERVRAGRPAPRRRDRPYGVPPLPADVHDC